MDEENNWLIRFERACTNLHDAKQKTRKEAFESVTTLLESPKLIKQLNKNDNNWNAAFTNVKSLLYKEMTKVEAAFRKKSSTVQSVSAFACECRDLLNTIVKYANKKKGFINFNDFYRYLKDCTEKPLFMKFCLENCLKVFEENFLSLDSYWDQLNLEEIIEMKDFFKKLHTSKPEIKALRCYNALLRKGTDYKLPISVIKEEVDFVRTVVRGVILTTIRWRLEASAETLLIFCQSCGETYRQLCTTLGEECIMCLFNFVNPNDSFSTLKTTVMKIMVLQLEYHNCVELTEVWRTILLRTGEILYACVDINDNVFIKQILNDIEYDEDFVNVSLGCVRQCYGLSDNGDESGNEPVLKRAKHNTNFMWVFQNNMQNYMTDRWILLFSLVLEKCPELITESHFNTALDLLSKCVKTSRSFMRGYVFQCLSALVTVEEHLMARDKDYTVNKAEWLMAYDSAIGSIGLNQKTTESHQLIQNLLIKKSDIFSNDDATKLWNLYKSHTIQLDENSLKTFHTFATHRGLLDNSTEFKNSFIDFILQQSLSIEKREFKHFVHDITAEVLANLTFKYYNSPNSQSICNNDCYNYLLSKLKLTIDDFTNKTNTEVAIFLYIIKLNSSLMLYYRKIDMNLTALIELSNPLIQTTWPKTITYLEKLNTLDEHKFSQLLNLLLNIFKTDEGLGYINKTIELPFVEAIVDAQSALENDSNNLEDRSVKLRLLIVNILTVFALNTETDVQQQVQNMLYEFDDFDPCNAVDYQQAKIILSGLQNKNCRLCDNSVEAILKLIKKICLKRIHEYDVCVDVLKDLKNSFWHLVRMENLRGDTKNDFLSVFKALHHVRRNYGYKVELTLVECFDCLLQGDKITWAKYNDELLVLLLPYYLESEFLQVQTQVIKTLSRVFGQTSNNSDMNRLKSKIIEKVLEKFDAQYHTLKENDLTGNFHKIVLSFFTETIISAKGTKFSKCALNELFVRSKKYQIPDEKVFSELLKVKAQNIDITSYLSIVLHFWSLHYSILDFPYIFFGFDNKNDFLTKSLLIVIPIVLRSNDEDTLEIVCSAIGKSDNEVLEECFPKFISLNLIDQIDSCDDKRLLSKSIGDSSMGGLTQVKLDELINTDKGKQMLKNTIDDILVEITTYVHDAIHFEQFFNYSICLAKPDCKTITHDMLSRVMLLLSTADNLGYNVLSYIVEKRPSKLQQVLLKLRYKIWEKHNLEDKINAFYHYAIFVQIILEKMQNETSNNYVMFILRDVLYTNINMIKYDEPVIRTLALKYMSKIINLIIPKFTKQFVDFIIVTCSCVIPQCIEGNPDALNVLKTIITSNDEYINDTLQYLDPLPEDNHFVKDIRHKHMKFRAKDNSLSLENEIKLFLVGKQFKDSRTEGLKYLRVKLKNNIEGLKNIYLKLHEMRGILSKDSVLHSLITTLVMLVKSKDKEESLEAVKCLGILGASDLTTMVLKSEDTIATKDSSLPLFTTKVLELLHSLMIDYNLDVVKNTSKALYAILSTDFGREVMKSEVSLSTVRGFFLPFISKGKNNSMFSVTDELHNDTLCDEELWCPESGTHDDWIKRLVTKILEGFHHRIMKYLIPIVEHKASFAEDCFPFLINLLFDTTPKVKASVGKCFQHFFEKHWVYNCKQDGVAASDDKSSAIVMNISSIRCILNTIHFVRLQRLCDKRGKYQELEMDLNYLHVAKAAEYCSAHFSALMYSEKWYHLAMKDTTFKSTYHNLSPISYLDDIGQETSQLRFILTQAYKGIGDNYALFGGHLENILTSTSMSLFKNTSLDFQLLHHDIQMSAHGSNQMIHALKDNAWYNLALGIAKDPVDYGDAYYESMWRMSQWDLPNNVQTSKCFEFHVYNLLTAINDNDKTIFDSWVNKTRLQVAESLKSISLESCKTLYGPLSHLERLQELEDIFTLAVEDGSLRMLVDEFKVKDGIPSDYQYWEPKFAQRIEAINLLQKRNYQDAQNTYVHMSLNFADISREHGNLQISKRILTNFVNLDDSNIKAKVALLDARIDWKLGHSSSSISMLKKLLKSYDNKTRLRATILKLCGEWMVENQSEFPQKILTEYFGPSLDILNDLNSNDQKNVDMLHDVYKTLAKFADEEYQHINKSIKSPEFERKIAYMKEMQASAIKLNKLSRPSNDIKRAIVGYERMTRIDEIDIKAKYKERDTFLKVAIQYYFYNMKYSTQDQAEIFRIFSLWLENKTNTDVITSIEKGLLEVESYKILPMLPQLVPHISDEEDRFSEHINRLIEKCAKDHPHHAIPLILSVANTNKDDDYTKENAKTASNESRIRGASTLIKSLRSIDKYRNIIEQNEKMASAFIQLAYYKVKANKGDRIKIPRSLAIYDIKDYTEALMPTYKLPCRPNLNYSTIVGVHKFKQEFTNVGGVNAPKQLECIDTEGKARFLLVKGQDDLRQDAVMQQVFVIMNQLLRDNKETINFKIRTYKVIPLSKRSGVLEWVNGSMPIGEYLCEAHAHYYPKNMRIDKARMDIKEAVSRTPGQRLKTYLDICERIHPVFHKFFETNFLEPTVWYEKRRAYTQSVATSSMCGYVLGIGDRHVQNILVDKITGEVIHIDFGIAFEQGRILPTPETVPFRLTRDIVDGMGICGVEGTFRRTCEKTMEALRRNVITIQTILEVLLYDPLYVWSITPTQAYSKQFDDEGSTEGSQFFTAGDDTHTNVSAERALSRMIQKLLGNESGNNTNVETQVDRLIQQAREPSNLSKLFHGWQAYL